MGISSAQKKESMKISHSHPSIIEIDFLAIKKETRPAYVYELQFNYQRHPIYDVEYVAGILT